MRSKVCGWKVESIDYDPEDADDEYWPEDPCDPEEDFPLGF